MRRGDLVWAGGLGLIVAALVLPASHAVFVAATRAWPYPMGFLKVAVLATMGELLALRLKRGQWLRPVGLGWRVAVWGGIGVSFVLVFDLFANGTAAVVEKGLLPAPATPGFGRDLALAFWTSLLMNLIFAPTFMALHRVTDTWIDLGGGLWAGMRATPLAKVVGAIDWRGFIGVVVAKTIPCFWVPAHTVTFLLPSELRVAVAALLSIALGAILATLAVPPAPAADRPPASGMPCETGSVIAAGVDPTSSLSVVDRGN